MVTTCDNMKTNNSTQVYGMLCTHVQKIEDMSSGCNIHVAASMSDICHVYARYMPGKCQYMSVFASIYQLYICYICQHILGIYRVHASYMPIYASICQYIPGIWQYMALIYVKV